jgi:hypothetical protein
MGHGRWHDHRLGLRIAIIQTQVWAVERPKSVKDARRIDQLLSERKAGSQQCKRFAKIGDHFVGRRSRVFLGIV